MIKTLLSVELSAACTTNSTQNNVRMTVWFAAMENYHLAAILFYRRISCETIRARLAGGSSNEKLEILEASRTVVCLYVYDSLQEGMFGVLCCLFIITQYQPISCQYSWLSNKQPIRIDWVEYNYHGEFPIQYLHALLIYHIFLTGMDTTKSLPLGNHSIYMPQWVIELRRNAIKLLTRVYLS